MACCAPIARWASPDGCDAFTLPVTSGLACGLYVDPLALAALALRHGCNNTKKYLNEYQKVKILTKKLSGCGAQAAP